MNRIRENKTVPRTRANTTRRRAEKGSPGGGHTIRRALAIGLISVIGACTSRQPSDGVSATKQALSLQKTFALPIPMGLSPQDLVLGATNGIALNDRSQLRNITPAGKTIAGDMAAFGQSGAQQTVTGSGSLFGHVWSVPSVWFRGSLLTSYVTSGSESDQNGTRFSEAAENRVNLPIVQDPIWTIPVSGPDPNTVSSLESFTVDSGHPHDPLAPGDFGTVNVHGGTLQLRACGNYGFVNLGIESGSSVQVIGGTPLCATTITVSSTTSLRGTFSGLDLFAYLGTAPVFVQTPGNVGVADLYLSPNAGVSIMANATGRFFATDIMVFEDHLVTGPAISPRLRKLLLPTAIPNPMGTVAGQFDSTGMGEISSAVLTSGCSKGDTGFITYDGQNIASRTLSSIGCGIAGCESSATITALPAAITTASQQCLGSFMLPPGPFGRRADGVNTVASWPIKSGGTASYVNDLAEVFTDNNTVRVSESTVVNVGSMMRECTDPIAGIPRAPGCPAARPSDGSVCPPGTVGCVYDSGFVTDCRCANGHFTCGPSTATTQGTGCPTIQPGTAGTTLSCDSTAVSGACLYNRGTQCSCLGTFQSTAASAVATTQGANCPRDEPGQFSSATDCDPAASNAACNYNTKCTCDGGTRKFSCAAAAPDPNVTSAPSCPATQPADGSSCTLAGACLYPGKQWKCLSPKYACGPLRRIEEDVLRVSVSRDCATTWTSKAIDFVDLKVTLPDGSVAKDMDRWEAYFDPFTKAIYVATPVKPAPGLGPVVQRVFTSSTTGPSAFQFTQVKLDSTTPGFDALGDGAPRVMTTTWDPAATQSTRIAPFVDFATARCAGPTDAEKPLPQPSSNIPRFDVVTPFGLKTVDIQDATDKSTYCDRVELPGLLKDRIYNGPSIVGTASYPPRFYVAYTGRSASNFEIINLYQITLRSGQLYAAPAIVTRLPPIDLSAQGKHVFFPNLISPDSLAGSDLTTDSPIILRYETWDGTNGEDHALPIYSGMEGLDENGADIKLGEWTFTSGDYHYGAFYKKSGNSLLFFTPWPDSTAHATFVAISPQGG